MAFLKFIVLTLYTHLLKALRGNNDTPTLADLRNIFLFFHIFIFIFYSQTTAFTCKKKQKAKKQER